MKQIGITDNKKSRGFYFAQKQSNLAKTEIYCGLKVFVFKYFKILLMKEKIVSITDLESLFSEFSTNWFTFLLNSRKQSITKASEGTKTEI